MLEFYRHFANVFQRQFVGPQEQKRRQLAPWGRGSRLAVWLVRFYPARPASRWYGGRWAATRRRWLNSSSITANTPVEPMFSVRALPFLRHAKLQFVPQPAGVVVARRLAPACPRLEPCAVVAVLDVFPTLFPFEPPIQQLVYQVLVGVLVKAQPCFSSALATAWSSALPWSTSPRPHRTTGTSPQLARALTAWSRRKR